MIKENEGNKPFDPNDANRDPISGQPGAHPVGTGVGAAGAGAIGAAIGGVVGGPVGAVVGSVVGAVAGGLAGKGAAEKINPTVEDEYWQDNYSSRPYYEQGRRYEDYQPAYRAGYEGYGLYSDRSYDEIEPDLRRNYETNSGGAGLAWDKAKYAVRDAWDRVSNSGSDNARSGDENVRLYEERLVADKQRAKTGEVSIGKHVETETARVSVPVEKEEVIIERTTPAGGERRVAPGEATFGAGEVARVELYEETPDIHKETFVREEVNVKKVVEHDTVTAEEKLRREELDVDTKGRPIIDNR